MGNCCLYLSLTLMLLGAICGAPTGNRCCTPCGCSCSQTTCSSDKGDDEGVVLNVEGIMQQRGAELPGINTGPVTDNHNSGRLKVTGEVYNLGPGSPWEPKVYYWDQSAPHNPVSVTNTVGYPYYPYPPGGFPQPVAPWPAGPGYGGQFHPVSQQTAINSQGPTSLQSGQWQQVNPGWPSYPQVYPGYPQQAGHMRSAGNPAEPNFRSLSIPVTPTTQEQGRKSYKPNRRTMMIVKNDTPGHKGEGTWIAVNAGGVPSRVDLDKMQAEDEYNLLRD